MNDSSANVYCVNYNCKTSNPLNNEFCSQCHTPIIKRYLWALGEEEINIYTIGDLIANRYLVKQNKILLDTQPGIVPNFPEHIPDNLQSYLKLFGYRLHVPQIYGYIDQQEPIWLLEYSSVSINKNGELIHPQLFPRFDDVWQECSALRQLNLLWQIIKLWQPLSVHQVVSSLFNQNLLRVNGSVIQLLELQADSDHFYTLKELGSLWLNWSENCSENIGELLQNLALSMQKQLITQPEKILNVLDQAIHKYANDSFNHQYTIITLTDTGQQRKQNEDACYPPPNTVRKASEGVESLTLIGDGLGGQEGGEIASNLAIKTISEKFLKLTKSKLNKDDWNPLVNEQKITNIIHEANNQIIQRNNQEKRIKLARMGTTLVMTWNIKHEIYLGYVGDSRIYWITDQNCHQVSVDDDLASRQVRLGYAFYRNISQYPKAGALIQALGTNNSHNFFPHIQRLILDQDCIFLLCSDGLSDFDKVEQYWQSQILPILNGQLDLKKAAENLLDIGINKNGHDNVTLGLVYCQVQNKKGQAKNILSWDTIKQVIPDLPTRSEIAKEKQNTQQQEQSKPLSKSKKLIELLLIGLVLVVYGMLFFTNWESIKNYFFPPQKSSKVIINN